MNYVNYCIVLSFLFATIKCGHAENPKLTVELMSSGFHRFVKVLCSYWRRIHFDSITFRLFVGTFTEI